MRQFPNAVQLIKVVAVREGGVNAAVVMCDESEVPEYEAAGYRRLITFHFITTETQRGRMSGFWKDISEAQP